MIEAVGYSFEKLQQPVLDPESLPTAERGVSEPRPMDEVWPDSQEVALGEGEFDFGL